MAYVRVIFLLLWGVGVVEIVFRVAHTLQTSFHKHATHQRPDPSPNLEVLLPTLHVVCFTQQQRRRGGRGEEDERIVK